MVHFLLSFFNSHVAVKMVAFVRSLVISSLNNWDTTLRHAASAFTSSHIRGRRIPFVTEENETFPLSQTGSYYSLHLRRENGILIITEGKNKFLSSQTGKWHPYVRIGEMAFLSSQEVT